MLPNMAITPRGILLTYIEESIIIFCKETQPPFSSHALFKKYLWIKNLNKKISRVSNSTNWIRERPCIHHGYMGSLMTSMEEWNWFRTQRWLRMEMNMERTVRKYLVNLVGVTRVWILGVVGIFSLCTLDVEGLTQALREQYEL